MGGGVGRAVDFFEPVGKSGFVIGDLPHGGVDEMAPGDFIVEGVGARGRGSGFDGVDVLRHQTPLRVWF